MCMLGWFRLVMFVRVMLSALFDVFVVYIVVDLSGTRCRCILLLVYIMMIWFCGWVLRNCAIVLVVVLFW